MSSTERERAGFCRDYMGGEDLNKGVECDVSMKKTIKSRHKGGGYLLLVLFSSLAAGAEEPRFVDHSLLIAPEYPCTWPASPFPRFVIAHQRTIGPDSVYNVDVLL